jgi:hypothetical protein
MNISIPDPDWILIQLGLWIRIQAGKTEKKLRNVVH